MFRKQGKKENEMAQSGFVKVARASEIKPGQIKELKAGSAKVAVANVSGQYYAFSPWCPHQGWPLWSGDLKGELVRCYLHRWQFNVRTGENEAPGGIPVTLPTYPLKVEDGEIWVDITNVKPFRVDSAEQA
ncbi:MAG: non-heme iron oxygenase ferredoxin subunit [Chloroflexi bacterium]|uniref:Non-heme iron oxygenase ferredoxin subunit n=1 Tax=Candidatus Chlorohelix allophototropha TaxID=3003348 RepID=A0A8T7LYL1_9CHLR|nr:non-heme iron oxygenase ferredoxin subunit [Chloroflexota bacterium]WJW66430.1 non-heme iron oxygenase ferredoxin subunit [Chloroflexota bacterium L227-S17]